MIEFFYFLGILLIGNVWWTLLSSNQYQKDKELLIPRVQQPTIPIASTPLNVVARSVDDVLGTYKNEPICKYVQLDDGRLFTFESIAVERSPGIYHADDINGTYIIVDMCLLYRKVCDE